MLHYLFYKLYKATLKGSLQDFPSIMAAIYTGGLVGINFLVAYLFLVKLNVLPYLFKNAKQGGWFIASCIILSTLYFDKKKSIAIFKKYEGEGNRDKIRGNVLVAVYVIISFFLIYFVGLYRPGKL